jgi:hypothetical protein
LSNIVGINVFITSRQTIKMPDRMRCLGKVSKDYFIMLHQHFVADAKHFEFYMYVKTEGTKYLLTRNDFGTKFGKCVNAKCTRGFVSGDVDDVCPPYTKI